RVDANSTRDLEDGGFNRRVPLLPRASAPPINFLPSDEPSRITRITVRTLCRGQSALESTGGRDQRCNGRGRCDKLPLLHGMFPERTPFDTISDKHSPDRRDIS